MPHETDLIVNIAIALAFAFIGGFIATRLRMPAILGYLLAGVAIGPHTPGFIANLDIARQLAEIGVVLLMFGVGLHFSLRDLLAVRMVAIPGAVGQIAVATGLGLGLGLLWGWGLGAGLVLGLAISVASTVVLVRALTDRAMLDSIHGHVAVGWLIVEDLFTVLVLVLLPVLVASLGNDPNASSTLLGGSANPFVAVGLALAKVAAFSLLMLLVGPRVVPWILRQVARTGSKEVFTLGVLVVALGIAVGSAALFGVSLALGAFLAGLVISESDLSHQAAADALPLRDAFAVLFFVSVGMLFDPRIMLTSLVPLLAVLAVVVIAKPLVAAAIVFVLHYPIRTGLTVAAGLAQIGEFSFILAEMARRLGVLPEEGYTLVIAGSIASIAINPLWFRAVNPLETWLRGRQRLSAFLARRSGAIAEARGVTDDGLRGHAVLCGYGRVGSVIAEALSRRNFRYVVIDQNRRVVEDLRRRGISAYWGDAGNPILLNQVNLKRARVLVLAIPDPMATWHASRHARRTHPGLNIIARTHSEQERANLQNAGVSEARLGERELAIEMASYSLRRFGVSAMETLAIVQALRIQDPGHAALADSLE